MCISWAQQAAKQEMAVILGKAWSFRLETAVSQAAVPWGDLWLRLHVGDLGGKRKRNPRNAAFLLVLQALHSRCPQGSTLPLGQVRGCCIAWPGVSQCSGAGHLDRKPNRNACGTMWEVDCVWWCWGLCRCWGLCSSCEQGLQLVSKAVLPCGCARCQQYQAPSSCMRAGNHGLKSQSHWCQHQKGKTNKAMWQIEHNASLDLPINTLC